MNPRLNRIDGFTLIELLVVIAVIALMAALLLPVLGRTRGAVKRTRCLSNLGQINLGTRMYCDDSNDVTPGHIGGETNAPWIAYKELMKQYVGLHGRSSRQDKLFACPADTFYYDWTRGYVAECHHDLAQFDYSRYAFNSLNLAVLPTDITAVRPIQWPGVGGRKLSSIKHPSRTILIAESPSFYPYSWHQPRPYKPGGVQPRGIALFNNAMNTVSFVDGHVLYTKIYWGNIITNGGFMACYYDPPAEYAYQWSGD